MLNASIFVHLKFKEYESVGEVSFHKGNGAVAQLRKESNRKNDNYV